MLRSGASVSVGAIARSQHPRWILNAVVNRDLGSTIPSATVAPLLVGFGRRGQADGDVERHLFKPILPRVDWPGRTGVIPIFTPASGAQPIRDGLAVSGRYSVAASGVTERAS
jgi:hypothetical protein